MKAITIKEPWASLIVDGHKTIETRHWSTGFRGWLAVHTSKAADTEACHWLLEKDLTKRPPLGYTHQAVIGAMRVVDCRALTADDEDAAWCECAGLYGMIVDAAVRIEPVQIRGSLGLWELLPEAAAVVRRAVEAFEMKAVSR